MRRSWFAGAFLAASVSSYAFIGQVSVGHAQVQGLDDAYPSRRSFGGCPGGYVEGLGCSSQRPTGPGIQDSDQGWQRDWQDFGAGAPGLSIFADDGGGFRPHR